MRFNIFLAAYCAMVGVLTAQPLRKNTPEAMLAVANEQRDKNDYFRAAEWYEKYYDQTKDQSVLYDMAMAYFNERDYAKAEKTFKRVTESKKLNASSYPTLGYNYGRSLKMNGKPEEAIPVLQAFLNSAGAVEPFRILAAAELEGAQMSSKMKPVAGVSVENAGKGINTQNGDYSPSVNQANGDLYFTAYRQPEIIVVKGDKGDYTSQVMVAKKVKGVYNEAVPADKDINREGFHHGNVYISPDGKEMFFTRVLLNGNAISESKIYKSNKQGTGWSPAKEVATVNGNYIAKQPCLGELYGKDVLFFVSNMEGGKGGYDIYYCTRNGDKFEAPVNLGSVINTPGDEETPHYRGGKLYFSSNGHPGIGGFDLFSSVWDGTKWSKPENMGIPFNSVADDQYLTFGQDEYSGFLVSNREGTRSLKSKTCCDDIWQFTIEKPVINLVAQVLGDGKPISGAQLQLIDMTGGNMGKTESKTNDKGSKYDFNIDFNKTYTIITTKAGFYPDTTTFTTVGLKGSQTVEKSIVLKPVKPIEEEYYEEFTSEEPIRLDKILYDYRKWDIRPEAARELDYVDSLMRQYPDMVIELSSHTDARGDSKMNQELSQKRAESARNYLIAKGIAPERIKAVGYGETQIINRCVDGVTCSEEEHQVNRRTEMRIISGPTSIKITRKEFKKRLVNPGQQPAPPPAPKQNPAPAPKQNPAPAPKQNPAPAPKQQGGRGQSDVYELSSAAALQKAEMLFEQTSVDFGTITKSDTPSHTFWFTNTGDEDIVIELVSGCDCTEIDWSYEPVSPGQRGYVKATYIASRTEPADMNRLLTKDLTIILANTHPETDYPMVFEVKFTVFVKD